MTTICLPSDAGLELVEPIPDGLEALVWDGTGEAPAGIERTEFVVPPYGTPGHALLARMPAVRVVQLLSAGAEPWVSDVADGVLLCNARGVHGASTAELGLAGLLALLRELPVFLDQQRTETWQQASGDDLASRRVLILGAGDIGDRIAAAVRVFDADVTVIARRSRDGVRSLGELPSLLPTHDVVVIALPHTPETHGLVDTQFLASMPDGAVLVNIARGQLVDTDALVAELQAGRLRAFLDVTEPEPLPTGHPLWSAPNLLLTPHVGGGTRGWDKRAYRLVRAQLMRFLAGEPLVNAVESGY
jgi:phosphoglycerate dehydrogenase-like enzyme